MSDSPNAVRTLTAVVSGHLRPGPGEVPEALQVRAALAAAFQYEPSSPVTDADLARAALDVLAEDNALAQRIREISREPTLTGVDRKYIDVSGIGLTTAVLIVLQTRIKFKIDHKKQFSLEIEKKALTDASVRELVHRLLSYLDHLIK